MVIWKSSLLLHDFGFKKAKINFLKKKRLSEVSIELVQTYFIAINNINVG